VGSGRRRLILTGQVDACPFTVYNSKATATDPMTWSPCSDIATRNLKWVSSAWNLKNSDGRSAAYIAWGVSADSIAASYGTAYADDLLTPLT